MNSKIAFLVITFFIAGNSYTAHVTHKNKFQSYLPPIPTAITHEQKVWLVNPKAAHRNPNTNLINRAGYTEANHAVVRDKKIILETITNE